MKFRLEEINIYPIKSLGKISLKESTALIRGFRFDRRMMLTDGEGQFLSQRRIPEMATFKLSLNDEGFIVQHNNENIHIPFNLKAETFRKVTVWGDQIIAPEAEKEYSRWFSDHLNQECYLVFMDDDSKRPVDHDYAVYNEQVSYADGFPYLIIGTGSLEDLNQKLEIPVPMDRFRPNIVLSTDVPFVEDDLETFQMGEAIFKRVKPCSRCMITTIDQSTGIRSKEPLKTLSAFRNEDQKVLFGQNLICLKEGLVKTKDILIPISKYKS
jgi:uncharacterized protein YcbX